MGNQEGFIATVKLGPKGQIVIPKEVRDMFHIGPGDTMILMAAPDRGIALQRQDLMMDIARAIMDGNGKDLYPHEKQEDMEQFAEEISNAREVTQ